MTTSVIATMRGRVVFHDVQLNQVLLQAGDGVLAITLPESLQAVGELPHDTEVEISGSFAMAGANGLRFLEVRKFSAVGSETIMAPALAPAVVVNESTATSSVPDTREISDNTDLDHDIDTDLDLFTASPTPTTPAEPAEEATPTKVGLAESPAAPAMAPAEPVSVAQLEPSAPATPGVEQPVATEEPAGSSAQTQPPVQNVSSEPAAKGEEALAAPPPAGANTPAQPAGATEDKQPQTITVETGSQATVKAGAAPQPPVTQAATAISRPSPFGGLGMMRGIPSLAPSPPVRGPAAAPLQPPASTPAASQEVSSPTKTALSRRRGGGIKLDDDDIGPSAPEPAASAPAAPQGHAAPQSRRRGGGIIAHADDIGPSAPEPGPAEPQRHAEEYTRPGTVARTNSEVPNRKPLQELNAASLPAEELEAIKREAQSSADMLIDVFRSEGRVPKEYAPKISLVVGRGPGSILHLGGIENDEVRRRSIVSYRQEHSTFTEPGLGTFTIRDTAVGSDVFLFPDD